MTTAFSYDGIDLLPVPGSETAVLVLPGGRFREHTEHDGAGYARWLNSIGISAAVLRLVRGAEPRGEGSGGSDP